MQILPRLMSVPVFLDFMAEIIDTQNTPLRKELQYVNDIDK